MATDPLRRRLLVAGAGLAAAGLGWRAFHGPGTDGALLLAACDTPGGGHCLAGWELAGGLRFRIRVPQRAHAIAPLPGGRALFFARRPGTLAYVVDTRAGERLRTLESVPGRHFYGHGVVTPDASTLFTTENDYARRRGVIGVYDAAADFRRLGEIDAGGIGPHELALLADGRTLAVAVGGIETHPDRPREKLNIGSMQPLLAYVDTATSRVIDWFLPPDPQMSLRHLAVTRGGRVVIGVQYEGDGAAIVPLMFTHAGEASLVPAEADEAAWRSHANYVASVAVSADGRHALLTAPRGNTVSLWDLERNALAAEHRIRDAAGAAPGPGGLVVTNGLGHLYRLEGAGPRRFDSADLRWDNHLAVAEADRG